jgi:hypothetical protein
MDASTLTFPLQALEARRPDGMIEYAIIAPKDEYQLIWETVIAGKRQNLNRMIATIDIGRNYDSLGAALEAFRPQAEAYFQSLESGAAQPAA